MMMMMIEIQLVLFDSHHFLLQNVGRLSSSRGENLRGRKP